VESLRYRPRLLVPDRCRGQGLHHGRPGKGSGDQRFHAGWSTSMENQERRVLAKSVSRRTVILHLRRGKAVSLERAWTLGVPGCCDRRRSVGRERTGAIRGEEHHVGHQRIRRGSRGSRVFDAGGGQGSDGGSRQADRRADLGLSGTGRRASFPAADTAPHLASSLATARRHEHGPRNSRSVTAGRFASTANCADRAAAARCVAG